jgi:hypothetical protein
MVPIWEQDFSVFQFDFGLFEFGRSPDRVQIQCRMAQETTAQIKNAHYGAQSATSKTIRHL